MKIDHVFAQVNRTHPGILRDITAQTAVKGEHGVGILHGQGDVVKAENAPVPQESFAFTSLKRSLGGGNKAEATNQRANLRNQYTKPHKYATNLIWYSCPAAIEHDPEPADTG